MPRETILVVEDEYDIQELIEYNLEKEGFKVVSVTTAEEALKRLSSELPALVLLDLMLPEMDGLSCCRQIRRQQSLQGVPIIMLTAKGEESDIVAGLEVGADDYITKPFSPRVLVARIRAVLRRGREVADDAETRLVRGNIVIDSERFEVLVEGRPVDLTFTEFKVLEMLARRPGVVSTRYQIVDAVRGSDYPVTDRSVDVQIVGLRKKLGEYSDCVETVRGVGYRFRMGSQD